jgi:hypothetical protein
MSDENYRHTLLFIETQDCIDNLLPALRVKHCGRLVENHTFGPHCKNTRYCDSLLLTAGKTVRLSLTVLIHIDRFERLINTAADFSRLNSEILGAESNIILNYCSNYLIIWILENHADYAADSIAVFLGNGGDALNRDRAFCRLKNGIHQLRKGALSRAVVPKHSDEFSFIYIKTYIFNRGIAGLPLLIGLVGVSQIFDFDEFFHYLFLLRISFYTGG